MCTKVYEILKIQAQEKNNQKITKKITKKNFLYKKSVFLPVDYTNYIKKVCSLSFKFELMPLLRNRCFSQKRAFFC